MLQTLSAHLVASGRRDRLDMLLTTFAFLQAKLAAMDPPSLIADYDLTSAEQTELRLIQGALRLAAHILDQDVAQLATQLFGRLQNYSGRELKTLLEQARLQNHAPWLRPIAASLASLEESLVRTLAGHTGAIMALVITPDSRYAISASTDHSVKVWDLVTGMNVMIFRGHTGEFDLYKYVGLRTHSPAAMRN